MSGSRRCDWRSFLSTYACVYNTFAIQRHLISRKTMPEFRNDAMAVWQNAVRVG